MNHGAATGPTFEEALARLEQVVAELERGDLSLERALALFEEGVGLARLCALRLAEAERRIELLVEQNGDVLILAAPDLEAGEAGRGVAHA